MRYLFCSAFLLAHFSSLAQADDNSPHGYVAETTCARFANGRVAVRIPATFMCDAQHVNDKPEAFGCVLTTKRVRIVEELKVISQSPLLAQGKKIKLTLLNPKKGEAAYFRVKNKGRVYSCSGEITQEF